MRSLCVALLLFFGSLGVISVILLLIPAAEHTMKREDVDVLNISRAGLTRLGGVSSNIYKGLEENGEVVFYVVHDPNEGEGERTASVSTETCCSFFGDGIHWLDRNMPMKVYQSSLARDYMSQIEALWRQRTAIDLIGTVTQSNVPYTEQEILASRSNGINTVGYKILVGDFANALAIARIVVASGDQHITHCSISVNADIGNICDATHNASCYDLKSILNHEFGHCFGLMDEYASECALYLMYGSLAPGNIRKRSLDDVTQRCAVALYNGLPEEGEPVSSGSSRLRFSPFF